MNNKLIIDNFQNDFTKVHTKMNKGIAILFMVYYHLFVLHNNLDVTYLSLPDLVVPNIHYYLANFGKICVCIYCFLSGIGAFYSQQNAKNFLPMYKKVLTHLGKFFLNYWIIAMVTIPFAIHTGLIDFSIKSIFYAMLGSVNEIAEWWFVKLYVFLQIISPVLIRIIQEKRIISKLLSLLFLFVMIAMIKGYIYFYGFPSNMVLRLLFDYVDCVDYWYCILIFIIGIICVKYNLYSLIPNRVGLKNKLLLFLFLIISIAIRVIFSNNVSTMTFDWIVVPIFVFTISKLLYGTKICKFLCYFGKHSTNIWLIHCLWLFYFASDLVYFPYVSIFIYLWLLILSLLSSYIINLIYVPLCNLFFSRKHKLTFDGYFYYK